MINLKAWIKLERAQIRLEAFFQARGAVWDEAKSTYVFAGESEYRPLVEVAELISAAQGAIEKEGGR